MNRKFIPLFFHILAAPGYAGGLYDTGVESVEALPITWSLGTDIVYDDNVLAGSFTNKDSALAISPNVGLSYISKSARTTLGIDGNLGLIHYLDAPDLQDKETYSQSRLSGNLYHSFDERLKFKSQNYIANELEPDYSYGIASSRTGKESLSLSTLNALVYRWSERYATDTGVKYTGNYVDLDGVNSSDRTTIEGYNQIRYDLSEQSVLTADYRFLSTTATGVASDSTDQLFLVGIDRRFSANSTGVFKTGLQYREVDQGDNGLIPYLEISYQSQVNESFKLGAFVRHSAEVNDTVLQDNTGTFEYDDRRALRFGGTSSYSFSPDLSILSGVDLIFSDYLEGRNVNTSTDGPDKYETSFNAYVGVSFSLTEFLKASMYYNFAQTNTDISDAREYVRNRISLGLTAEF
jgi:hypothetical protein